MELAAAFESAVEMPGRSGRTRPGERSTRRWLDSGITTHAKKTQSLFQIHKHHGFVKYLTMYGSTGHSDDNQQHENGLHSDNFEITITNGSSLVPV